MTATMERKVKTIGKLSKTQARIDIAKDVLKHLNGYNVVRGSY